MNIDLILLKLLLNKNLFNKYNKIINLGFYKDNNKELFKLFLALFKLHETTQESVTTNDLTLFFYTLYPMAKADEKILIDATLSQVNALEVDESLALDFLKKHNEQSLATSIAIKALEVSQGKADMSTVRELLEGFSELQEEPTADEFVTDDLDVLVNDSIASQGLRWRLNTMNKALGSLRQGDFGFIFARPETGKTTFLASEVTFMALQLFPVNKKVLWLNNEEQGSKVMLRCYQAVFGVSQQELFTNLDFYKDEYIRLLGNTILIKDEARITKKIIEKLCEDYDVGLIVIDQIDKLAWEDNERYDLKMKAIYQFGRELSKKNAPVIAVCQAGGTAEGKKYLNMNDVDSSHTAKQGEADFMLGIGKTNNDGEEYMRFLSVCKNKLAGDVDSIPELRHGKLPIVINPSIARYEDSMRWD